MTAWNSAVRLGNLGIFLTTALIEIYGISSM